MQFSGCFGSKTFHKKFTFAQRGEVKAVCFFQIMMLTFAILPGFFRLFWNNFTPLNGCMDRYGNKFKNRYNPNT